MTDRFCPTCGLFRKKGMFRIISGYTGGAGSTIKIARDCVECEDVRIRRLSRPALKSAPTQPKNGFAARSVPLDACREFPGVDIDAIHRNRGALNSQISTAAKAAKEKR